MPEHQPQALSAPQLAQVPHKGKRREVMIVGAGVAGLALARGLALRGHRVTVLEQAEAIREYGAGLQISPNGLAVLNALGLDQPPEADRSLAVQLRDGPTGREVAQLQMARLRPHQRWSFMHRADLISLLDRGAREAGVEIRLLQKIEALELSAEGPVLTTAQGAAVHAPVVIGADGLHSVVRKVLNPASRAFFTGQVAWRATIPCEEGAAAVAQVHMGAGRHLVSYPLRGGSLRNIVAVEERRTWAEENWSAQDDPDELRHAFKDFSAEVQAWLAQVETCWLWGLFRHPVAHHWGRVCTAAPESGIAVLGDAAHPTLPFLAQGANLALEDAWVLAEELSADQPLAAALTRYQARRKQRVTKVVDAASANARNYHLRSPLREVAHFALRNLSRYAPDRLVGRYDWIHAHDVTRKV